MKGSSGALATDQVMEDVIEPGMAAKYMDEEQIQKDATDQVMEDVIELIAEPSLTPTLAELKRDYQTARIRWSE